MPPTDADILAVLAKLNILQDKNRPNVTSWLESTKPKHMQRVTINNIGLTNVAFIQEQPSDL